MKILFCIATVAFNSFCYPVTKIGVIDKNEAKKAFNLLNNIRQNPEAYSEELKLKKHFQIQKSALTWNDTLALAAEAKAIDMISKGYFDHVNPHGIGMNYYINKSGYKLKSSLLEDRKANDFESIGQNFVSGEEAIIELIIDRKVPSKGHKRHLLGNGDSFSKGVDIGIGFAREKSDTTETITCILIAYH